MNKIIILLSIIISATNSLACDCIEIIDYPNANNVFIARVIKMELIKDVHVDVTLEVNKVYKGQLQDSTETIVRSINNVCGFQWKIGGTYLVFEENNNVNFCSSTTEIKGFNHDENGNWIGTPTLEEVKGWGIPWSFDSKWVK